MNLNLEEKFERAKLAAAYYGSRGVERLLPCAAGWGAGYVWFRPFKEKASFRAAANIAPAEIVEIKPGSRINLYRHSPSTGSAGCVLLVHGWSGSQRQFKKMIAHLTASGRAVVAFDFPAHGRSPGTSTDIVEMAAVLKAVMRSCPQPLDLVCHSLGLLVAAQVLKGNRHLIRRLISIASPHRFAFLVDQFLCKTRFHPSIRGPLVQAIQRRVPEIDVERDIDLSPDFFDPERWLMLHDRTDEEVPLSEFQSLARRFPAARVVLTEGLGHNVLLRSQSVIDHVERFLSRGEA